MDNATDTTQRGRPVAALFGTQRPVPRATLARWALRLEQEASWAHPALLASDAHRLLYALGRPGPPLLACERAQWAQTARRIAQTAQAQLDRELRAVFRSDQGPKGDGAMGDEGLGNTPQGN
jgi:hypothetical protein